MVSFRGDAHRFYLKLKAKNGNKQEIDELKELKEITDIMSFYEMLPTSGLKKVKFYLQKEFNGTGAIPLLITAVPWLLFIFSKPLLEWLFKGGRLWMIFVLIYITLLLAGVILHFRERAWAKTHLVIIEDILEERKKESE